MDQSQVVKLLLENRDVLLGFIYALTRDFPAAEEIFQETSLVILEEGPKQAAIGNFLAWARAIARRRVAEYWRKTTRRQGIEQLSGSMGEIVEQAFAEHELPAEEQQMRMQFLLECLERLAGRSREVVTRFYRQHQSLKAIAAEMGWQADSVKVALSRARKTLADCIEMKIAHETR